MNKNQLKGRLTLVGIIILFCFFYFTAIAHVITYDLKKLGKSEISLIYLDAGFEHIIPKGFDHILFIISLYLLNPKLKSILWQATAFTVAHSITLGLAMAGIIQPPGNIIEPIIALSIAVVALENIFISTLKPWRVVLVFLFGLVHGTGFSAALSEAGLPKADFLTSLVMFNLGVELGQVSVILILFLLIGYWFGNKPYYRKYFVIPLSIIIFIVSMYWMIIRVIN